MSKLKGFCAIAILTMALGVPTFAGDIATPGFTSPPPAPTGDIGSPGKTSTAPGNLETPGTPDGSEGLILEILLGVISMF